jgi:hypothetical protein
MPKSFQRTPLHSTDVKTLQTIKLNAIATNILNYVPLYIDAHPKYIINKQN